VRHWTVAVTVDPCSNLSGIEAQEVSPFDVGDAAFVDEAPHVSDLDPERGGDLDDGEKSTDGRLRLVRGWTCHDVLLFDVVAL
jgi:hypothetical protein